MPTRFIQLPALYCTTTRFEPFCFERNSRGVLNNNTLLELRQSNHFGMDRRNFVRPIYKMVGNPSGLTYHRLPATPGDATAPFRDSRHHRLGRISFGRKLPQKRRPSREPTLAVSFRKNLLKKNYRLKLIRNFEKK